MEHPLSSCTLHINVPSMKRRNHLSNCYRGLFLLMILLFYTQSVNADWKSSEFIVDNVCYRKTSQSEVAVTYDWCYINDGTGSTRYTGPYEGIVTIPEHVTYNSVTYKVTSIDAHALEGRSSVTSVSLPNTISRIGEDAFYHCSSLTSVNIPNSVTKIGRDAFYDTGWYNAQPAGILYLDNWLIGYKGNLPSGGITIKNGTKRLAESVFSFCTDLTSVAISNSVTYIGESAFSDCSGLTSVQISDLDAWCKIEFGNSYSNPLYYAHHLFLGEEEITDLRIPNNVTSIRADAFYGCSGLISVTIPNSVNKIGGRAFWGCSGLTSVKLSQSVTGIDIAAFMLCM